MFDQAQQQTAILFFSRSPQEEVNAKQLTFRRSRTVVRLLLEHSLRQARKTQLPLYTCYTDQQRGADFGERLANALEDIFAGGHERVIVIGNDSPGLRSRHLLRAEEQLRDGQLVLGPAEDGGVYLIGINQQDYNRNKFLELAWETPFLQKSWATYINQLELNPGHLPNLVDLDSATDFWCYIRRNTSGVLARRLKVCLQELALEMLTAVRVFVYLLPLASAPPPRRGPPSYI
jgi:hypothetical protein